MAYRVSCCIDSISQSYCVMVGDIAVYRYHSVFQTEILITYSYRVIAVGDGSLSAGCGLYIGTFYFSSPSTDDDLVEFIDKLPANANCPALTTKVAKFISTDLDCNKNLKLYSDVCCKKKPVVISFCCVIVHIIRILYA